MELQIQKFLQLINSSSKILITSHISPDPDAMASVLLLGATLRQNFPEKQIEMVIEEKPDDLSFMPGFELVKYQPVYGFLSEFEPDLFILVDGNNYDRCSRHNGQNIRDFIREKSVKSAIIDHHELAGKDEATVFINNHSPSTVQDVYGICFNSLNLSKPDHAAQTAMIGFYADTGGFVYVKDGNPSTVFGFAEELVTKGADIETVKNQLNAYTENDLKVIGSLAANIGHEQDYSYSFLTDEFIQNWLNDGNSHLSLQRPTNTFLNDYIRNIEGRKWGFIVYKNVLQGENYYSVSFRSQGGEPDVSIMATALGGGGHKPAAGAKFEASSVKEAIAKVKNTISALGGSV